MPFFEFVILGMDMPGLPDQIDTVGDFRQQRFDDAKAPVGVVVLRHQADGVAAGVGGVIPGAVVVGGPVDELQVGVGPDRVGVEKIGKTELPEAHFDAPARQRIEQRKIVAIVFYGVFAEREHFVEHAAAEIGRFAELRVAHDIEIGIAGEAEALAEGGAPGLFDVDQDLKGVVQAEASVEREDA